MRWLKGAVRAMLRRAGYTVLLTETYRALEKERDALQRRAMRDSGLEKLLGADEAKADDYQVRMAQHGFRAAYDDLEPEFLPLMESVRPYTMTSVERMYLMYKCAEYVARARVSGDILECGVWRGGSMMLVARTLLQAGDASRRLHLFDTYEGHPRPDSVHDVDLWGSKAIDEWSQHQKSGDPSGWARVSIDEVRANMASTGYPMDKVRLVKGMVEDTAAANAPEKLALLRLDTDWYASAKVSLEVFWPRLQLGGVLIVDDYGHYQGQRKAVDEYFAGRPVLLHRIDYSCRAIVKTS